MAENGYVYYLTIYDTGDVPLIVPGYSAGTCSHDFETSESVEVSPMIEGNSSSKLEVEVLLEA